MLNTSNKKFKKVAVIGTGVIGSGWIIRFLAHDKIVYAFDKNFELYNKSIKEIKRTWPHIKKFFGKTKLNLENLKYCNSIEEATKEADFIQECVSENYVLKTNLMRMIDEKSKKNAIISSSSSGLLPTRIYAKCKNPERTIIGHPFNPVYLLPAVEIVSGKKTSKLIINKTFRFYKSISMNPIIVKNELPGYLSDRLQEALWREGLHIIKEGYATTKDLDRAIEDGPGLRWSLMGTFLTFHLAGGNSGMSHMLEQFGPALKLPWTKLKAPKLTKNLVNKLVDGTKKQSKGKSVAEISNIRDEYLVELLKLRKKYEKKLR